MDFVIIDKVYINNKELLINIFESFYIQKIGSNMIFKIRLFDKIFYSICFYYLLFIIKSILVQ